MSGDGLAQIGDRHGFDVGNLGTNTATLGLNSNTRKQLRLEMVAKLGVTRDWMRIILDQVSVDSSQSLEVNMKPGLGGLELVTPGLRGTVPVSIEAMIDGRAVTRNFLLPIHQGARLKVSTALFENARSTSPASIECSIRCGARRAFAGDSQAYRSSAERGLAKPRTPLTLAA